MTTALPPRGTALTAREVQVAQLVAHGLTNPQIAAELGLSEHTVKRHVKRVSAKYGVSNRVGITRTAIARGLVAMPARRAGSGRAA